MKANEFVEKFGWEVAATDLRNHEKYGTRSLLYIYDDLKRLVESHELVSLFDDIERAKAWINDLCEDWPYQVKGSDNKFFKWQLEQAIADVESCQ